MPRRVFVFAGDVDGLLHGLAVEKITDSDLHNILSQMVIPPDPYKLYEVNKGWISRLDCYRTFIIKNMRGVKRVDFSYLHDITLWVGTTPRADKEDTSVGTFYYNGDWSAMLLGVPPTGLSIAETYYHRRMPSTHIMCKHLLETARVLAATRGLYADNLTLTLGGQRLLRSLGIPSASAITTRPRKYNASGPNTLYSIAVRLWGGGLSNAIEKLGEYDRSKSIRDIIARKTRNAAKTDEMLRTAGLESDGGKSYIKTHFELFHRKGNRQILDGGPLSGIMSVRGKETYSYLLNIARNTGGLFLVRPDIIGRTTVERDYPSDILPR
jgi:hypothetical protein